MAFRHHTLDLADHLLGAATALLLFSLSSDLIGGRIAHGLGLFVLFPLARAGSRRIHLATFGAALAMMVHFMARLHVSLLNRARW